jgi:integrase
MDHNTLPALPVEPLAALVIAPDPAESPVVALPISPSTTEAELIALWLHGKGSHTIRAYAEDVAAYRAFSCKTLRGEEADGNDRVFPMTACNAWKHVKRAAQSAGIEAALSPHFLRHSHGTHALRRGADLATVRDTLGDESIATTGRYLHARPEKSSVDYRPY